MAAIPPLKDGDRLTRDEFMRRYEAMPNSRKPSSSKEWFTCLHRSVSDSHGDRTQALIGWLFLYRARTPGLELGRQ